MSNTVEVSAEMDIVEFESRAGEWLAENVQRTDEVPVLRGAELVAYDRTVQAKMFDAGFAALTQPREYGGAGLGNVAVQAWERAAAEYAVPRRSFAVSFGMCGPIINLLGTDEQKQKYLPRLWRGDDLWAQLFSEPGAGSDVAGLRMRAVRVTGGWRLSGQKVWSSGAQYCERAVIIARTNPDVPKHQGLTMFLMDMKAPGVDVRPIRVATGDVPFNEVFLDEVFIPDEDLLGELDGGWAATIAMLSFERISLGTSSTRAEGGYSFASLREAAATAGRLDQPGVRAALCELYVLEHGGTQLALRMREEAETGTELGARGSIAKLAGSTANRRTAELASRILGTGFVSWSGGGPYAEDALYPPITAVFASSNSSWTAGGTIEIQKGIIGERVLGLEKDPSADRGIPFVDIRTGA